MLPMTNTPPSFRSRGLTFATIVSVASIVSIGSVDANAASSKRKTSVGGIAITKPNAVSVSEVKFASVGDGIELGAVEGNPMTGPHASLVRFGPGRSLPNHSYSNAIRGVVISGKLGGTLRVNTEDVKGAALGPGAIFSFPAGLVHSTTCESTEPCLFSMSQDGPFVVTIEKPKA
jgi:quercetin dioxygenase-like cupin family protein